VFEALALKGLSVVPVGELVYYDNYTINAAGKQIPNSSTNDKG